MQRDLATSPGLKFIGYWRGGGDWRLPRPQWFVRPDWRVGDRERFLAYLHSGHSFAGYCGYSWCRFRKCDVAYDQMGSSDRTDGERVWPAGLAHYVEVHSVILPDEFVQTMLRNEWAVPASAAETRFKPYSPDGNYDYTFWLSWSRRNARRPWYWPW